jgi:hypothetical protein
VGCKAWRQVKLDEQRILMVTGGKSGGPIELTVFALLPDEEMMEVYKGGDQEPHERLASLYMSPQAARELVLALGWVIHEYEDNSP